MTPDQPPTQWTIDDNGELRYRGAITYIDTLDITPEALAALVAAVRAAHTLQQARNLAAKARRTSTPEFLPSINQLLDLLTVEAGAVTRAEDTP